MFIKLMRRLEEFVFSSLFVLFILAFMALEWIALKLFNRKIKNVR